MSRDADQLWHHLCRAREHLAEAAPLVPDGNGIIAYSALDLIQWLINNARDRAVDAVVKPDVTAGDAP